MIQGQMRPYPPHRGRVTTDSQEVGSQPTPLPTTGGNAGLTGLIRPQSERMNKTFQVLNVQWHGKHYIEMEGGLSLTSEWQGSKKDIITVKVVQVRLWMILGSWEVWHSGTTSCHPLQELRYEVPDLRNLYQQYHITRPRHGCVATVWQCGLCLAWTVYLAWKLGRLSSRCTAMNNANIWRLSLRDWLAATASIRFCLASGMKKLKILFPIDCQPVSHCLY